MKKKLNISLYFVLMMVFCTVSAGAETYIAAPEFKNDISLFSSNEVIEINHENTISEIIAMEKTLSHTAFTSNSQTRYEVEPSFTAPYEAGSLNQSDIDDAAKTLKMVRYLAGVPYENSDFIPEFNNIAQHGTVLLAASNQFSHYPSQPEDMSDEFYETALKGCNEANINAGRDNISKCVLGWIYDQGANNIERAGHRRWVLKPGNQDFGIGYAQGPSSTSYRGYRANMYVFGNLFNSADFDSYVAWPAAGDFPIQYMAGSSYIETTIDCPWSINLGASYAAPTKDDVTVKLTRKRDGKVWIFDKNTPNLGEEGLSDNKLHLSVDDDGYGMGKAIVFRPDLNSLGAIFNGDEFSVELSGIQYTDGTEAVLSYYIRFFDIEKERNNSTITIETTFKGEPMENATVKVGEQSVLTDEQGIAQIRVNNHKTYTYTVSKTGYNTETGTIEVKEDNVKKSIDMVKTIELEIDNTSDEHTFGVSISNNDAAENKNIKIYSVLYDNNNNTPIKIISSNPIIPSNGTIPASVTIPADDYAGASSIYAFVWDGMRPLCDRQILK